MNDAIEKLKNKEAKLNARSFAALNLGLDDEFLALLKQSDKLQTLQNTKIAFYDKALPEKRGVLGAAESKMVKIRQDLANIHAVLAENGIDAVKFVKNLDKLAAESAKFDLKFAELQAKLPEGQNLAEISPYLKGFCSG